MPTNTGSAAVDREALAVRTTAWLLAAGLAASLPFVVWGVIGAAASMNNEFRQWAPMASEVTLQYDEFLRNFDSDEAVLVSWDGCTLDDPRLQEFARRLTASPTAVADVGNPSPFQLVVTGPQLVDELMAGPLRIGESAAIRRLEGILVAEAGRLSGALVILSPDGSRDRPAAVRQIIDAAIDSGVAREEVHLAGPAANQEALERESRRSLYELTGLAALVSCFLAWLCLRNLRLALVVVVTAAYGAGATLSLVYYTGSAVTLVMTAMPVLVFVLGISTAVHLVNYYRDARLTQPVESAPWEAVRMGWRPCLLAAITTSMGMGSLATSRIEPVRAFGIYAAMGVLFTTALVLLALPTVLRLAPPPVLPRSGLGGDRLARWRLVPQRAALGVLRFQRFITPACFLAMLLCGVGIARMHTSVKLQDQFQPTSRIIQDYRWLESELGPVVPLEIQLSFAPECRLSLVERAMLVRRLEQAMRRSDDVGAVFSAATFVGAIPTDSSVAATARRSLIERGVQQRLSRFAELQLIREDASGNQHWRISVRVSAFHQEDYGQLLEKLRLLAEPVVAEASLSVPISVSYTGVIPLVYAASNIFLEDLFRSFALAFVAVAIVIAMGLRSAYASFMAMAPNLFPAVVVLGTLCWLGRAIDIGTMMTASVALGIAVDDTVHFLTWVRRGLMSGRNDRRSVWLAFQRCAPAMTQTTLICGLGLLSFRLCDYVPSRMFATLIGVMLVVALFGDLVFLPALILSRLGRPFIHHRRTTECTNV